MNDDEKNLTITVPKTVPITQLQFKFMVYHAFQLMLQEGKNYNAYLDNLGQCDGKSFDEICQAFSEAMPFLKRRNDF